MIKAFRVAMATAITAAAVIGVGSANAQVKGTAFQTGFQVVNLSDAEANITISFYAEGSGTAAATFNDTIGASGQVTYANLAESIPAIPEGFNGAAVISSDQEVAAITNVIGDGNFFNGAAISGSSAGGTEIQLPLLFNDNNTFDTFANIQNTGTAAANVTITYTGGGLTTPVEDTATIQPGSAARFDQTANPSLPAGFNGSAVVTSDQPITGAVIQNGNTAILGYNAFSSSSTAPYMPLINANNGGFITGISMQNAGDADTEVTISYSASQAGQDCTETQTIPAGGTSFFAINAFTVDSSATSSTCAFGETFVGSAQVTANSTEQPLIGIVNQLNQTTNKGGTFNSMDASEGTGVVVLPLVQDRLAGFFTGFSITNVGTAATAIECVYSDTTVTQSIDSLAPGETWTAQQANVIGEGYSGSGVCTASTSGAQIVGVLNQVNVASETDAFYVSNTINN